MSDIEPDVFDGDQAMSHRRRVAGDSQSWSIPEVPIRTSR